MLTASEYFGFARQCILWALESKDEEAEDGFIAMARDWTMAGLAMEQYREKQRCVAEGHQPQESGLPRFTFRGGG